MNRLSKKIITTVVYKFKAKKENVDTLNKGARRQLKKEKIRRGGGGQPPFP